MTGEESQSWDESPESETTSLFETQEVQVTTGAKRGMRHWGDRRQFYQNPLNRQECLQELVPV